VPENGHCTAPVCEGSYPASLRKKASFCIKLCSPIFGQDPHHLPQGFLRVYHRVGRDLLDAKEILVEVIPLLSLSKALLYLLAEGFLLGILLGFLAGLCLLTAPDINQKAHWRTNEKLGTAGPPLSQSEKPHNWTWAIQAGLRYTTPATCNMRRNAGIKAPMPTSALRSILLRGKYKMVHNSELIAMGNKKNHSKEKIRLSEGLLLENHEG
jgi:hypothetical protein